MAEITEVTEPRVKEDSKQQPHTVKYQVWNVIVHLMGLITSIVMWPPWVQCPKDDLDNNVSYQTQCIAIPDRRKCIPFFSVMYLVSCIVVAVLIVDDFKFLRRLRAKYLTLAIAANLVTEAEIVEESNRQQPETIGGFNFLYFCTMPLMMVAIPAVLVPSSGRTAVIRFNQENRRISGAFVMLGGAVMLVMEFVFIHFFVKLFAEKRVLLSVEDKE